MVTSTLKLKADETGISAATDLLRDGQLVAFPTDTVYGLGADASNQQAVAAIYKVKSRPPDKPLIVLVDDLAQAKEIAVFSKTAEMLAQAFWPGALTLVLPQRRDNAIAKQVTAGRDNIGIRIPDHPVARGLLRSFGKAIATPSANPSGMPSPTNANEVLEGLDGTIAAVIDGGDCQLGIASTILGVKGEKVTLLRRGSIPARIFEEMLGQKLAAPTE